MSEWAAGWQGVWIGLLNQSYLAGLVTLVVLLARQIGKKIPKRIIYFLWAVVLFRFLCPFSPGSVLSILPGAADPVPVNLGTMAEPAIATGLPFVDTVSNAVLQQAAPRVGDSVNPMQIWLWVGQILWLAGAAGLAAGGLLSWLRLRKKREVSLPLGGNVYLADGIGTPLVIGVLHPRIYLPSGLKEEEKRYILRHEQIHIRRRDPLWKLLAFAALCLHWFNPLAWAAFFCAEKDMEMSCDEIVLEELGDEIRQSYSSSLLNLSQRHRKIGLVPLAFGESNTGARIRHLMKYRKPGRWVFAIAGILAAVLAVGLLCNPTGTKVREMDEGELSHAEQRWLTEARVEAGQTGTSGVWLLETSDDRLLVYVGVEDIEYESLKLNAHASGKRLSLSVEKQDAVSESWISSELLAEIADAGRIEDCRADLEGQELPVVRVSQEEEWVSAAVQDLYALKNPYIGDAPADQRLLEALGVGKLGAYTMELQTEKEPYVLAIRFAEKPENPDALDGKMCEYGNLLLALIENCGEVQWSYPGEENGEEIWYTFYWNPENCHMTPMPVKECGQSAEKLEKLIAYQGSVEFLP